MKGLSHGLTTPVISALLAGLLAGCGGVPGVLPDVNSDISAESTSPQLESAASTSEIPANDCLGLAQPSDDIRQAMLDNLNYFRVAHGLQPLVYSARLQEAADKQVQDLYDRSFFAHVNPDGLNPGQRATAIGFCHKYVGENLAAGQKSADAAQVAWENSPSHRENMLEPDYKYVGMGFYQDPNGRMYWAQEMAYHVP